MRHNQQSKKMKKNIIKQTKNAIKSLRQYVNELVDVKHNCRPVANNTPTVKFRFSVIIFLSPVTCELKLCAYTFRDYRACWSLCKTCISNFQMESCSRKCQIVLLKVFYFSSLTEAWFSAQNAELEIMFWMLYAFIVRIVYTVHEK